MSPFPPVVVVLPFALPKVGAVVRRAVVPDLLHCRRRLTEPAVVVEIAA